MGHPKPRLKKTGQSRFTKTGNEIDIAGAGLDPSYLKWQKQQQQQQQQQNSEELQDNEPSKMSENNKVPTVQKFKKPAVKLETIKLRPVNKKPFLQDSQPDEDSGADGTDTAAATSNKENDSSKIHSTMKKSKQWKPPKPRQTSVADRFKAHLDSKKNSSTPNTGSSTSSINASQNKLPSLFKSKSSQSIPPKIILPKTYGRVQPIKPSIVDHQFQAPSYPVPPPPPPPPPVPPPPPSKPSATGSQTKLSTQSKTNIEVRQQNEMVNEEPKSTKNQDVEQEQSREHNSAPISQQNKVANKEEKSTISNSQADQIVEENKPTHAISDKVQTKTQNDIQECFKQNESKNTTPSVRVPLSALHSLPSELMIPALAHLASAHLAANEPKKDESQRSIVRSPFPEFVEIKQSDIEKHLENDDDTLELRTNVHSFFSPGMDSNALADKVTYALQRVNNVVNALPENMSEYEGSYDEHEDIAMKNLVAQLRQFLAPTFSNNSGQQSPQHSRDTDKQSQGKLKEEIHEEPHNDYEDEENDVEKAWATSIVEEEEAVNNFDYDFGNDDLEEYKGHSEKEEPEVEDSGYKYKQNEDDYDHCEYWHENKQEKNLDDFDDETLLDHSRTPTATITPSTVQSGTINADFKMLERSDDNEQTVSDYSASNTWSTNENTDAVSKEHLVSRDPPGNSSFDLRTEANSLAFLAQYINNDDSKKHAGVDDHTLLDPSAKEEETLTYTEISADTATEINKIGINSDPPDNNRVQNAIVQTDPPVKQGKILTKKHSQRELQSQNDPPEYYDDISSDTALRTQDDKTSSSMHSSLGQQQQVGRRRRPKGNEDSYEERIIIPRGQNSLSSDGASVNRKKPSLDPSIGNETTSNHANYIGNMKANKEKQRKEPLREPSPTYDKKQSNGEAQRLPLSPTPSTPPMSLTSASETADSNDSRGSEIIPLDDLVIPDSDDVIQAISRFVEIALDNYKKPGDNEESKASAKQKRGTDWSLVTERQTREVVKETLKSKKCPNGIEAANAVSGLIGEAAQGMKSWEDLQQPFLAYIRTMAESTQEGTSSSYDAFTKSMAESTQQSSYDSFKRSMAESTNDGSYDARQGVSGLLGQAAQGTKSWADLQQPFLDYVRSMPDSTLEGSYDAFTRSMCESTQQSSFDAFRRSVAESTKESSNVANEAGQGTKTWVDLQQPFLNYIRSMPDSTLEGSYDAFTRSMGESTQQSSYDAFGRSAAESTKDSSYVAKQGVSGLVGEAAQGMKSWSALQQPLLNYVRNMPDSTLEGSSDTYMKSMAGSTLGGTHDPSKRSLADSTQVDDTYRNSRTDLMRVDNYDTYRRNMKSSQETSYDAQRRSISENTQEGDYDVNQEVYDNTSTASSSVEELNSSQESAYDDSDSDYDDFSSTILSSIGDEDSYESSQGDDYDTDAYDCDETTLYSVHNDEDEDVEEISFENRIGNRRRSGSGHHPFDENNEIIGWRQGIKSTPQSNDVIAKSNKLGPSIAPKAQSSKTTLKKQKNESHDKEKPEEFQDGAFRHATELAMRHINESNGISGDVLVELGQLVATAGIHNSAASKKLSSKIAGEGGENYGNANKKNVHHKNSAQDNHRNDFQRRDQHTPPDASTTSSMTNEEGRKDIYATMKIPRDPTVDEADIIKSYPTKSARHREDPDGMNIARQEMRKMKTNRENYVKISSKEDPAGIDLKRVPSTRAENLRDISKPVTRVAKKSTKKDPAGVDLRTRGGRDECKQPTHVIHDTVAKSKADPTGMNLQKVTTTTSVTVKKNREVKQPTNLVRHLALKSKEDPTEGNSEKAAPNFYKADPIGSSFAYSTLQEQYRDNGGGSMRKSSAKRGSMQEVKMANERSRRVMNSNTFDDEEQELRGDTYRYDMFGYDLEKARESGRTGNTFEKDGQRSNSTENNEASEFENSRMEESSDEEYEEEPEFEIFEFDDVGEDPKSAKQQTMQSLGRIHRQEDDEEKDAFDDKTSVGDTLFSFSHCSDLSELERLKAAKLEGTVAALHYLSRKEASTIASKRDVSTFDNSATSFDVEDETVEDEQANFDQEKMESVLSKLDTMFGMK